MRALTTRKLRFPLLLAAIVAWTVVPFAVAQQRSRTPAPTSVRLYIFDCGKITAVGEAALGFQPGQLANTAMFTPCYLIVHPRGTMMWDTGEIPDRDFNKEQTARSREMIETSPKPQRKSGSSTTQLQVPGSRSHLSIMTKPGMKTALSD
jgi:hypothetical protein